MPGKLVFSSDMILNASFIAYQEYIRKRKQQLTDNTNKYENKTRKLTKYEETYEGPYPIYQVFT